MPGAGKSPPEHPKPEALHEPQRTPPQFRDAASVSRHPASDLDAAPELDCSNTDSLRPALAVLTEAGADRIDPLRFRYIQALVKKTSQQRPSVAPILETKALQALSEYLDAYLAARVATETPETADEIRRLFAHGDFKAVERLAAQTRAHRSTEPGPLAALMRDMSHPNGRDRLATEPSLEDELRRQELEAIQSVAGMIDSTRAAECDPQPRGTGELGAMRRFRESLRERHSEQRVARAIREGPENPGPLNAEALIVRSLSIMRNLSPSYANRFVAYVDTLLWLEQAGGATAPAKSRGAVRRKP